MAFTVNLYSFSKRDNSTAQPTGTGTEMSCVLKSGSGIMRPVLAFDIGLSSDPSSYNYAYISAFGRYYFIEEWYFDRALWTATLKVDVLATYKSNIGSASLYVLRAAGASDGNIIDSLYPCKTGCDFASDSKTNLWISNMCYVIGVVSKNATCGSLVHYAMDRGDFTTMCSNLLSDVDGVGAVTAQNGYNFITDCSQALQKSLVDPLQYVKTCIALPVSLSDVSGTINQPVTVFNWDSGVNGKEVLENTAITKTVTFNISKHPDTNSRGNYVNSAPYTNISLTIPPFGVFDIDSSVTCNATALTATIRIDSVTGKASLTITCNGIVLNRIEAQLGIPISLSSVKQDIIGAVSGLAGAVSGAVAGAEAGPLGIAVGAASGIANAVTSLAPRASTIGTTGSFGTLLGDFKLDHQFFRPVDDDNTHNGRPLCAVRQINNLSGYIKVQDGDVATSGTSAEDAAIRSYLEGGFYYE